MAKEKIMINHIEYAAANYGLEGIGLLQYDIFRKTLERLRGLDNESGIVYLNDLYSGDLNYMLERIKDQIPFQKLLDGIQLELLPGDIASIEVPHTKTAHLKHLDRSVIIRPDFVNIIHRLARNSEEGLEFTFFQSDFPNGYCELEKRFLIVSNNSQLYAYCLKGLNPIYENCGISTTLLLQPI